jgi:hypothetical protein
MNDIVEQEYEEATLEIVVTYSLNGEIVGTKELDDPLDVTDELGVEIENEYVSYLIEEYYDKLRGKDE